jgi:hypothetical protein
VVTLPRPVYTEVFRATSTDLAGYRERLIAFYRPYSEGEGQQDIKQAR